MESINLELRSEDFKFKAEILLDIAENWFSADDSVNAESYINKAGHIMHLV